MKVLTFTSLFPNLQAPGFGGFVARRMEAWAERYATEWGAVAPVPYFPRLPIATRWKRYGGVPAEERRGRWRVLHPRYAMVPKVGTWMQGRSMAIFSRRAVERLWAEHGPFDLVDAHYVYPDGYAAMLLARRLGVPLVVTARGTDVNLYPELPRVRPMIEAVLRRASRVVGVSAALVRRMVELGASESRCRVVSNGVDLDLFPLGAAALPEKPRGEVLCVGNLVAEKGVDVLLEALGMLAEDGIRPRLTVIGEGPQRTALETRAEELGLRDRVSFAGQARHTELPQWYGRAGVFCLPSLREGCPNVVLEALACGVPVVAAPVGGVPELVKRGVNGVLAADGTPAALAEALRIGLQTSWDPRAIRASVNGRSWRVVADQLHDVFREAVSDVGALGLR